MTLAALGWTPSRSTLCRMAATAADLMIPLVDRMIEQELGGSIVYTDDTTVTLLTPGEGKGSRTSRIWIYVGTEPGRCYDVFAFTRSRCREGPDGFLEPFSGVLAGDCYSGYVNIEQVTVGSRSTTTFRRTTCVAWRSGGRTGCSSEANVVASVWRRS